MTPLSYDSSNLSLMALETTRLLLLIMLKLLRFKFFVLFGKHTLLGKSLIALQLPTYLSNLTANG